MNINYKEIYDNTYKLLSNEKVTIRSSLDFKNNTDTIYIRYEVIIDNLNVPHKITLHLSNTQDYLYLVKYIQTYINIKINLPSSILLYILAKLSQPVDNSTF